MYDLATQFQSRLRHALDSNGQEVSAESARQVLLSHLATWFYFRTIDPKTHQQSCARATHPPAPVLPHGIDSAPMTSLIPGEAYWLTASGEWGRGQVTLRCFEVGQFG